MKECKKCRYFLKLYLKSRGEYTNANYGRCIYKSRIVANTHICTEYKKEEEV